jgi:serralysin
MSSGTNPIGVSAPSNPWLSGIVGDKRWYTAPYSTTIVYAAAGGSNAPTTAETTAYMSVFRNISAVCNITFQQGTTGTADLLLYSVTASEMQSLIGDSNTLGLADFPGYYESTIGDYQSSVFVNRNAYSSNSLNAGGYDYITWLHEIGHALGLAHPHDTGGGSTIYSGVSGPFNSYGLGNLNQGIFTTMGYNDGWDQYFSSSMPKQYGWQSTMMAFDVAALQYLYGANYNTATGNDGYVLSDYAGIGSSYQCIWDAGGWDQIYYGGSYGCLIDLRAATLDPNGSYGAGGFASYVYSPLAYSLFTIANGVTVEQAYSGSGNDTIIGNDALNYLYSNGGNDTVYGLGGNDFIWAGTGTDTVLGGAGNDSIFGAGGNDYLVGDAGNDAFNLYYDVAPGGFDYIADLTFATDYVLLPTAYNGQVYFYVYQGAAYGYVAQGASSYVFGAAGLTAAQLQASTFYY